MKKYKLIVFDLDGTLADTSSGIYECYKHTLKILGENIPTNSELDGVIGGSLLNNFQTKFGLNLEDAKQAVSIYREHYSKVGYKNSTLYADMRETLIQLKNKGYKVAVATLKAENLAIELLKELRILNLFDVVHGVDKNDILTKTDLINMCIQELACVKEETILIGDSMNDYIGANQSKVDFVAVLYGFGFKSRKDLIEINTLAIVSSVKELQNMF